MTSRSGCTPPAGNSSVLPFTPTVALAVIISATGAMSLYAASKNQGLLKTPLPIRSALSVAVSSLLISGLLFQSVLSLTSTVFILTVIYMVLFQLLPFLALILLLKRARK